MSSADWHRAQSHPLRGEGTTHFRGKQRVCSILRRCGFYSEVEHRFTVDIIGYAERIELRTDVYGVTPERVICVEVNGPGGHKSSLSTRKDAGKKRLICEQYTNINPQEDYFTFSYKDIIGREAWTDREIAEEMKIGDDLDRPCTKWL